MECFYLEKNMDFQLYRALMCTDTGITFLGGKRMCK